MSISEGEGTEASGTSAVHTRNLPGNPSPGDRYPTSIPCAGESLKGQTPGRRGHVEFQEEKR